MPQGMGEWQGYGTKMPGSISGCLRAFPLSPGGAAAKAAPEDTWQGLCGFAPGQGLSCSCSQVISPGCEEGSRLGAWAGSSAVPAVFHPLLAWQPETAVLATPCQGEIQPSPAPGRGSATPGRAQLPALSPALSQQIRAWQMDCRDLAVLGESFSLVQNAEKPPGACSIHPEWNRELEEGGQGSTLWLAGFVSVGWVMAPFDPTAWHSLPLSKSGCSARCYVIWAQQHPYKPTAVLKDTI